MRTTTYDALVNELSDRHGRDSILRYLESKGEDEIRTAIAEIGRNLARRIRPYTTPRPERLTFRTLVEFRWDAPLSANARISAGEIDMTSVIAQARHDTPIRTIVHGTWIHARTVDGSAQEIPSSMEPLAREDRAWHDAYDAALTDADKRVPWPQTPSKRKIAASVELGTYQTLECTITTDGPDTSGSHRPRLETYLQRHLDALAGVDVADKAWTPVEATQTPVHLISITVARTRYAPPPDHQGLVAYTAAFSRDQTMRRRISLVGPRHAPTMAVHRARERANSCTDWKSDDDAGLIRFDAIAFGDRDPCLERYVPEDTTP